MDDPLISFRNISKSYNIGTEKCIALDAIDLDIKHGEMVALTGPSGSGKTTAMQIMGLLDTPNGGDYYLQGKQVSGLGSDALAKIRNQAIGFVFQSFHLLPLLNAWQNVALPLHYRKITSEEMQHRAMEKLSAVGLAKWAQHRPGELSGGQQQRVAIARALVGGPDLLLADEPTGALDSKTGRVVMDLLLDLNQNHDHTVVMVTHGAEIAAQCQRIINIRDGKIVS